MHLVVELILNHFHQTASDNRNTLSHQANELSGIILQGGSLKVAETSSEPETSNDQKPGSQVGEVILEEFFNEAAPVRIFQSLATFKYQTQYQLHPSDLINAMVLHLVSFTHES